MAIDVTSTFRIPDGLWAWRPEASALLETANRRAGYEIDGELGDEVRLRIATLLGHQVALSNSLTPGKQDALGTYYASDLFGVREVGALRFAEQFVIDVTGIVEDDRTALVTQFGTEEAKRFVQAVYILEFTQRLEMIAARLMHPATATPHPSAGIPDDQSLARLLNSYQEAVVRGKALDPVTTEMVRLRCARVHNCRICQTLRLVEARQAGADDATTAKIDFYEASDLPERIKTALRVVDAFITRPGSLTVQVVDDARTAFSQEELAELCLDITKWSTQKIHVALGTDGADRLPKDENGLSYFGLDPDGNLKGFSATP